MNREEEIEEAIKELDTLQVTVLFWKMRRLTMKQIGEKMGWGESWAEKRQEEIFDILGFDPKMHWKDKNRILEADYYPILKRLTNDDPEMLVTWPLIATINDPLDDEKPIAQAPKAVGQSVVQPPSVAQGHRTWVWLLVGSGFLILLYIVYMFSQTPQIIVVTATQATTPPLPSQTQELTAVPVSETAVILTDTPLPTDTLPPTNTVTLTVEPMYTVGDRVRDNRVSLSLEQVKFNTAVSGVARTEIAVEYKFRFTNLTSGDLTLLIDKYYLSAVDNTGRTFTCTLFKDPYILDDLSETVQPGRFTEFSVMCGLNQQVTTDTEWINLTITEFTSLPEMTWTAEVQR